VTLASLAVYYKNIFFNSFSVICPIWGKSFAQNF
jgi:hypothetical protein